MNARQILTRQLELYYAHIDAAKRLRAQIDDLDQHLRYATGGARELIVSRRAELKAALDNHIKASREARNTEAA